MGKKMLNRRPTYCAGVHEEIEAAKNVFKDLSKQGKYAEAAEYLYTENAVLAVGGIDLAPARAGACARARVYTAYRHNIVAGRL
jgi:hypothetical protein